MKLIILTITITLFLRGCYMQNLGPVSDVTMNTSGGYWQLAKYTMNRKNLPISLANRKTFLATHAELVRPDTNFKSILYPTGTSYRVFEYYSPDKLKQEKVIAVPYTHDYQTKARISHFWFRINRDEGFMVDMDVDFESGIATCMSISNVMKTEKYESKLDTIRYIYVPTEKF